MRRPLRRYVAYAIVVLVAAVALTGLSGSRDGAAEATAPTGTGVTGAPSTQVGSERSPLAGMAGLGPPASAVEAEVVRVVDGDTIIAKVAGTQVRVRYIGIDAPESVKPNTPVAPFAVAATDANRALVDGRTVLLEKDVSETDQYGRLLRNVWVEHEGVFVLVALELVRSGLAQLTTFPPDVKYVRLLQAAQDEARRTSMGLWQPAAAASAATTGGKPGAAPVPFVGGATCHASYSPCLPVVTDLDCPDVKALGKAPVTVKGPDEYRLDRDGDGFGCE